MVGIGHLDSRLLGMPEGFLDGPEYARNLRRVDLRRRSLGLVLSCCHHIRCGAGRRRLGLRRCRGKNLTQGALSCLLRRCLNTGLRGHILFRCHRRCGDSAARRLFFGLPAVRSGSGSYRRFFRRSALGNRSFSCRLFRLRSGCCRAISRFPCRFGLIGLFGFFYLFLSRLIAGGLFCLIRSGVSFLLPDGCRILLRLTGHRFGFRAIGILRTDAVLTVNADGKRKNKAGGHCAHRTPGNLLLPGLRDAHHLLTGTCSGRRFFDVFITDPAKGFQQALFTVHI